MRDETRLSEVPLVDASELVKILFSSEDAAPSLRTIERWREDGLIPFVKMGRLVYYRPSDVKAAIERLTVQKSASAQSLTPA